MTDRARQDHWQKVYTDKSPTAVSWYQSIPARSLALIDAAAARTIIDIGGGASTLVDHLLQRPGTQVCVVDIALRALEHSRARQSSASAARVRWIEADVTGPLDALPDGWADLWHDRAVFHFLTEPDQQLAYARNLARILKPGGTAIIAAFALDGPEKCSGLPVCRHDATSIATAISRAGRTFTPVEAQREEHTTPWGSVQAFVYAVLKDSSGVA